MNSHGANEVFLGSNQEVVADEDIDTLLSRGVEKTKQLNSNIEKAVPTDEQLMIS